MSKHRSPGEIVKLRPRTWYVRLTDESDGNLHDISQWCPNRCWDPKCVSWANAEIVELAPDGSWVRTGQYLCHLDECEMEDVRRRAR